MPDLEPGGYAPRNPDYLYRGAPVSPSHGGEQAGRANLPWHSLTVDNAAFTTGQVAYVAIALFKDDIIGTVACKVGATAGGTLTHFFGALYGPTGTLIAQSTDQELRTITSGVPANTTGVNALAANKVAAFVLGSQAAPTPYTVPANGIYYVGIGITGTTIPSLVGTALATSAAQGAVLGTAAASLTGHSWGAFTLKPGLPAVAGNYYVDPPLSMLDASTAGATAPATITTNGAPSLTAKLPVVYAF